jgi:hypothetical protein
VTDTVNILGPEFMRRFAEVREQLQGAIAGLEEASKSIQPADTDTKRHVTAGLQRSIENIEQALDHLDETEQAASGKAEPAAP